MPDPQARIAQLEAALRYYAYEGTHWENKDCPCVACRALTGTAPAPTPEAVVRATAEAVATWIQSWPHIAAMVRAIASDPAAVRAIVESARKEQP